MDIDIDIEGRWVVDTGYWILDPGSWILDTESSAYGESGGVGAGGYSDRSCGRMCGGG